MKIITQETLINSLNISRDSDILFLLGAGCSINSGCMAASKLVLEFKRRLYCAKYGIHYDDTTLINDVFFAKKLKEEFDDFSVDKPYTERKRARRCDANRFKSGIGKHYFRTT